MAGTHLNINQAQDRSAYFQGCVERMLTYWRDHDAMKNIDIAVLDRERNRILNNITLGLDLQPLWPLVKNLVIAFAPYMERRGFWDTWHTILEQSICMAQRANDADAETTLTAFLARLCQRMSRPAEVVRHYGRVIQLARQCGNRFEEARACSNLGFLYIDGGHWWRSEVLSKHALAIFDELESDHGRAHTHNHLGLLYTRQKRWHEAEASLGLARIIWQQTKDEHSLVYAYMNLSIVHLELQNPTDALECLYTAHQISEQTGEMSNLPKILNNMAATYRQKNQLAEAEEYARKAEQEFRKYGDKQGIADVWQNLGIIHISNKQTAIGIEYLSESLALHRKLENKIAEANLIDTIKNLAALSGDNKTARFLLNLTEGN